MLDKSDQAAVEKAGHAVEDLFDTTLALGGTISGEHGAGITKALNLYKAIGRDALLLMRRIKQAFDPLGVSNPGRIFPESALESVGGSTTGSR